MSWRKTADLEQLTKERQIELGILRKKRRVEIQSQKRQKLLLQMRETELEPTSSDNGNRMEEDTVTQNYNVDELFHGISLRDDNAYKKVREILFTDDLNFFQLICQKGLIAIVIQQLGDASLNTVMNAAKIINIYMSMNGYVDFSQNVIEHGLLHHLPRLCQSDSKELVLQGITMLHSLIIDCNCEEFAYRNYMKGFHLMECLQIRPEMIDNDMKSTVINIYQSILQNDYIVPTSVYPTIVTILFSMYRTEEDRNLLLNIVNALNKGFKRVEAIPLLAHEDHCRLLLARMDENFLIKQRTFTYFHFLAYHEYYELLHNIGVIDILVSYLSEHEDEDMMKYVLIVLANISVTSNYTIVNYFASQSIIHFVVHCVTNGLFRSCSVDFAYIMFNCCNWTKNECVRIVYQLNQSIERFHQAIYLLLREMKLVNERCYSFGLYSLHVLLTALNDQSLVELYESYGIDALLEDTIYMTTSSEIHDRAQNLLRDFFNNIDDDDVNDMDDYCDHSFECYDE